MKGNRETIRRLTSYFITSGSIVVHIEAVSFIALIQSTHPSTGRTPAIPRASQSTVQLYGIKVPGARKLSTSLQYQSSPTRPTEPDLTASQARHTRVPGAQKTPARLQPRPSPSPHRAPKAHRPSTMSSLYRRVSGLRPSPLRDLHLQASDPPASATQTQLDLFDRVLDRRSSQLDILPQASLETVYDLLSENNPHPSNSVASEIRALLKELPDKEPKTKNEFKSIVKFLIVENFHRSTDTSLADKRRTDSLNNVKHIFACLDLAYTDYAEEIKDKKAKKEAEKKEKLKALYKDSAESAKSKELAAKPPPPPPPAAAAETTQASTSDPASASISAEPAPTLTSASTSTEDKDQQANTTAAQSQLQSHTPKDGPSATSTNSDIGGKKAKEELIHSSTMGAASSRPPVANPISDGGVIELLNDTEDELETEATSSSAKKPQAAQKPETPLEEINMDANEQNNQSDPSSSSSPLSPTGSTKSNKIDAAVSQKEKEISEKKLSSKHLASVETKKKQAAKQFQQGLHPRSNQPFALPPQSGSRNGTAHFRALPDIKNNTNNTFSCSLREQRAHRDIHIYTHHSVANQSMFIGGKQLHAIHERYTKWEPYWKCIEDFSTYDNSYSVHGVKTAPIIGSSSSYPDQIQRGLAFSVNIPLSVALAMDPNQKFKKQHRERRLLLRALPLVVEEKYKTLKSDTHLWPKGTFVQVNSQPLIISQRKQQSHDEKLWKGISHISDMTHLVRPHQQGFQLKLEICTKDTAPYHFQLALCEYTPPENLFEQCIGHGERGIIKLSYEEGRALVQHNLDQKDAVVLDDSDGEDNDTSVEKSNIYSLLCKVSMSAIQTPVRGKHCKHIQCFDLKNYLLQNATVSGGRWRCVICEDFVPVQDLMIDGFMAKILEEHGQDVTSARDKIEIHRDGSYKLLNENRLRYQLKRSSSALSADQPAAKRAKKESEPAVIDILDDDDD